MNNWINIVADAAQTAAPAAGTEAPRSASLLETLVPIAVIVAVFIFFNSRMTKKQQQKRQELLDKLVKGSRVMLSSGIFGNVTEVKEATCIVEIADKVRIEVLKSAVTEITESDEASKAKSN